MNTNNEINTLIKLKYGEPNTQQEYIASLPRPVCDKLSYGWPFITEDEVRTALIAYELGYEIPRVWRMLK